MFDDYQQSEFEQHLASLQQHLTSIEHLYITYAAYEHSFNALVVELERRRRYRDAAEEIVRGMSRQLEAMRQGSFADFKRRNLFLPFIEEILLRHSFRTEHGGNLPNDLCSCVENIPTQFIIKPSDETGNDELPVIDEELLAEVSCSMQNERVVSYHV